MKLSSFLLLMSIFATSAVFSACGDGICSLTSYPYENCKSCPQDCVCPGNSRCDPLPNVDASRWSVYFENQSLGCVHIAECGDGFCDDATPPEYNKDNILENCANCPADCSCSGQWNDWGSYHYYGILSGSNFTFRSHNYCDVDSSSETYGACVAVSYCGDGACDWENRTKSGNRDCADCPENCATCPQDCDCKKLSGVESGVMCNATNPKADRTGCFSFDYCGNNYCGWGLNDDGTYSGETCKSCAADCGCTGGNICAEVGSNDRFWDPPFLCINTSSGTSMGAEEWTLCADGSGKYCHTSCPDGYCDPARGESCGTCADCGCDSGEHCDTNSNNQDSRGCVAGAANAGGNATAANATRNASLNATGNAQNADYETSCTNGIDDDGDGLVDCADVDCEISRHCSEQVRTELSQELKDKYLDELERLGMDMHTTAIETYAEVYGSNPEKMMSEITKYMDEKVYKTKQTQAYMSIFKDDPQKLAEMQAIINGNQNDLITRDIELQEYVCKNSKEYKDETTLKNYVENYVLNPPKWLYGGEYNSGGALDWANFGSKGFITLDEAVGGNPPSGIKTVAQGTTIIIAVYDAKDLVDKADTLRGMQIDDNTKVAVVVLDGALKIGKILDPTGYFGNLGDATVGKVIQVGQQIEERRQGCVTWNGKLLCQQADGSYMDELDASRPVYDRVGGGWFGSTIYVPRQ